MDRLKQQQVSYLKPDMLRRKLGSIGKGIPGVELKVIDENGNLIKTGETEKSIKGII